MKIFVVNLLIALLAKLGVNVVKVEEVNVKMKSLQSKLETMEELFLIAQKQKAELEQDFEINSIERLELEEEISHLRYNYKVDTENLKVILNQYEKQIADMNKRICNLNDGLFPDFLVVAFKTVEVRQGYDVTDKVIYVENGEMKSKEIVTRNGLVWHSMWEDISLSDVTSYEELLALDQRHTIYYD